MLKQGTERCPFSLLAYQILVVEKVAPVSEIAIDLNLTADALYSRLNGRTRFRAAEIKSLVDAIDDPRLLQFFVDNSRFLVVRRPQPDEQPHELSIATATAVRAAADIMQIMSEAIERGRVLDPQQTQRVLKEVNEAETALANLRLALEPGPQRAQGSTRGRT